MKQSFLMEDNRTNTLIMESNLSTDNFTSSKDSQYSKFRFNPKKIIHWASFLLIVGIVTVGFFTYFKDKKISVVPVVEAKELFTLYFDIDHIREESAKLFAELLEASQSPERIGGQEQIGKKLPLRDPKTLIDLIKANRIEINQALSSINEKSFSDSEVSKKHQEVRAFYSQIAQFEDKVIEKLDRVQEDKNFPKIIDEIFELEPDWENLLSSDRKLRSSLKGLASSYEISFNPEQYDEIFRKALVNLSTNVVSKESKGFVVYPFEIRYGSKYVPVNAKRSTVNVSWEGISVENFTFILVHPDGRIFNIEIKDVPTEEDFYTEKPLSEIATQTRSSGQSLTDMLEKKISGDVTGDVIPFKEKTKSIIAYGHTAAVINIYHDDIDMQPIEGEWKLYVIAPGGVDLVFGAIHL